MTSTSEPARGGGPYSRRWHEANIDRLIGELAEQVSAWYERDREDWREPKAIASRVTNLARALSAETQALALLNWQEYSQEVLR